MPLEYQFGLRNTGLEESNYVNTSELFIPYMDSNRVTWVSVHYTMRMILRMHSWRSFGGGRVSPL
jgi:hypothetical protein